jgi:hypothetical protein
MKMARPGVEGGKQMEYSFALIFALHTSRLPGLRRQGWSLAGARLQVGLFIHAEYDLMRRQRTAIEIAQIPHRLGEGSITGDFGRQPQMMTPRSEPVMQQQAPDTLSRDAVHHSLGLQLPR